MNNIEQYKKRFFNLMESTIGDIRPLINEQGEPQNSEQNPDSDIKYSFKEKDSDFEYFVKDVNGKFRIFVKKEKSNFGPRVPTATDAETVFGKGYMWKDYNTVDEAIKAIKLLATGL
jgi:hypothetical protein